MEVFGDYIGVVTYTVGFFAWFFVWHVVHGDRLMKHDWLLRLPFFGCQFVLVSNIILSYFSHVPPHNVELDLYKYVEENAKVVASLALAVCILIIMVVKKRDDMSNYAREFLNLILWTLLFSVGGVLPLYWMPARQGWLTALRHLKSVPYFYSLFILIAAAIVFIRGMQKGHGRKVG